MLRSKDGREFQGLFMNKTRAHDTQDKKHKQIKAGQPASFLRLFTSQAKLSLNLSPLVGILLVHDLLL